MRKWKGWEHVDYPISYWLWLSHIQDHFIVEELGDICCYRPLHILSAGRCSERRKTKD
jgi:hypothetical protein